MSGTATPATEALTAAGIQFVVHEYVHDPRAESYGLEAADALGVEPERVFKTLMASLHGPGVDGSLGVGIVPVVCTLDLKSLAAALGGKRAQMADQQAAQRATGYVLGGISPIGQKRSHPTVVDETAELWDTVFVSGGRRGLDLELSPQDLVSSTSAALSSIAVWG